MRYPQFIGPAYTVRSLNFDAQRCVNLYPEINEMGTGKDSEVAMLTGTPGLKKLVAAGNGPCRALWYSAPVGRLFMVSGATLYEIDKFWTATDRGTLTTSTGPVSIADNGIHMMLVDGVNGWTYTFATNTLAAITDTDFPGASSVAFQDGFFVFNEPGTGKFWLTASYNGASIDATDFATSEGRPDHIVALISNHRYLWIMNQRSTEVYYNSGNADFPFERIEGAFIEHGCAAAESVRRLDNAVFWLGRNEQGQGVVYRAENQSYPQRVSTHAIELLIQSRGELSGASAWVYQREGHAFYCLNIGTGTTIVYDTATGLWHERMYLDNGQEYRHRAECHAVAFNTHVVGDYEGGNLYALSETIYLDDGQEIARIRTAPHLSQNDKRLVFHSFQLDMEPGTGLDQQVLETQINEFWGQGMWGAYWGSGMWAEEATVAMGAPGLAPDVMLSWSNDGGHTFTSEHWRTSGKLGDFRRRAVWRRLGMSRDRVFMVKMTAPVKVAWTGAEVNVVSAEH